MVVCYNKPPPGQPKITAGESIVCRENVQGGVVSDLNELVSGETEDKSEMKIRHLKRECAPHLVFGRWHIDMYNIFG